MLIAHIGTDAACCRPQRLLANCEHKVPLDDLAAHLPRYTYRTGTAIALVHNRQPMSQMCVGTASTSLCSPAVVLLSPNASIQCRSVTLRSKQVSQILESPLPCAVWGRLGAPLAEGVSILVLCTLSLRTG